MRKRPESRVEANHANGSDHREGALQCRAESGSKGWNAPGVTSTDLDPDQDTHAHVCAAKQMGWRNVPEQDVELGGHVCGWCGIGVV